jgi:hypothetical protein
MQPTMQYSEINSRTKCAVELKAQDFLNEQSDLSTSIIFPVKQFIVTRLKANSQN